MASRVASAALQRGILQAAASKQAAAARRSSSKQQQQQHAEAAASSSSSKKEELAAAAAAAASSRRTLRRFSHAPPDAHSKLNLENRISVIKKLSKLFLVGESRIATHSRSYHCKTRNFTA